MGTAKTMKLSGDKLLHHSQVEQSTAEVKEATAQRERARQERMQALKLMFGVWKGRTDIPGDGLVFQNELRSE